MSAFKVWFSQVASSPCIEVDAEDYEEATDKAWNQLPGSLCHQCAGEVDLSGDWEPCLVEDANGNVIWEHKR